MQITRDDVLQYHAGGKIGLRLTRPLDSVRDLCLAYTPGVAEAVRAIAADREQLFQSTAKSNLVAVVSDGTAILGLGDLGAEASTPVMEGKAVLFKTFGDVDAWPVPINRCRRDGKDSGPTDPQRVIDFVAALAPMYGGINLEDIAAPACFEIEDRLEQMLDIPVFHDDQWGTAVITLAAIYNYCRLCERQIAELRIVINGAGAAGIRIADMLREAGARHILLCDSKGVIRSTRTDLNSQKRRYAAETSASTLAEAMRDAHVFIGVSVANCVKPADVSAMAPYPAIFAMANPDPEIRPEAVAGALGSKPYVMATGRSDFPNQINNVLGFPFLFRGALDVRARVMNMAMKMAAARALADLALDPVPEGIRRLYNAPDLAFGRSYIIPKPFDRRLFRKVPAAVAAAAIDTGVAAKPLPAVTYAEALARRDAVRVFPKVGV